MGHLKVLLYHVSGEDGLHLGGRKVTQNVRGKQRSYLEQKQRNGQELRSRTGFVMLKVGSESHHTEIFPKTHITMLSTLYMGCVYKQQWRQTGCDIICYKVHMQRAAWKVGVERRARGLPE